MIRYIESLRCIVLFSGCGPGEYQPEVNVKFNCQKCPFPLTTKYNKSKTIGDCVCGEGYQNPPDFSKDPLCEGNNSSNCYVS